MDRALINPSSERFCLAGLFQYGPPALASVMGILDATSFGFAVNAAIFRCVEHAFSSDFGAAVPDKLDVPTLLQAAAALGLSDHFSTANAQRHLRGLTSTPVEPGSVRRLAIKVRKLALARRLLAVFDASREKVEAITGEEPVDRLLSIAQDGPLGFVKEASTHGEKSSLAAEGVDAIVEKILSKPGAMCGVPTGFRAYDASIGGGLVAGIHVIAARSKAGKSFLADNAAFHIAQAGYKVLLVETEQRKEQRATRWLSYLTGIPELHIRMGQDERGNPLSAEQCTALRAAPARLRELPFYFESVVGKRLEEAIVLIRRWLHQDVGIGLGGMANPCAVVFDYLKLLDGASLSSVQETQALGFMMIALHNLLVEYGVGCLMFAQGNREAIGAISTAAVAASDRILWNSSSLSLFRQKKGSQLAKEADQRNTHELYVLACRFGPGLGEDNYINMRSDYAHARLTEGPTRDEAYRQAHHGVPPGNLEGEDDDE